MENSGMDDAELPLVYVIGDSISIQYGPYLEQGLRGFLRYARKSGLEEAMKNLNDAKGANGGDSNRVLAFLRAKCQEESFHPRFLLINCGLHDIRRHIDTKEIQVPVEQYAANLREIIALCRKRNTALVWIRSTHIIDASHNIPGATIFRSDADARIYNAVADQIMTADHVPIIDLRTFTLNLGAGPELLCDHVHFNEDTRKAQGAFIAGWLVSQGAR